MALVLVSGKDARFFSCPQLPDLLRVRLPDSMKASLDPLNTARGSSNRFRLCGEERKSLGRVGNHNDAPKFSDLVSTPNEKFVPPV
jgi:hypothetical protein